MFGAGITATQINAGNGTATFSFYERSLNDTLTSNAGDAAGVNLIFLDAAGTQIGTATSGQFYNPVDWTLETTTAAIPVGTRLH